MEHPDCEAYDCEGRFISWRLDGRLVGGRSRALSHLIGCGFSIREAGEYLETLPIERWNDEKREDWVDEHGHPL